ncbi:MAG: VOC family protein [Planctomycetota bacterium]
MAEVNPVPKGFNTVNSYLFVDDAKAAIEFYKAAFFATEGDCMVNPDGSIMHAEIVIGNSTVMLSQANPQWGTKSAKTLGGSPVSLHVYADNADELFESSVAAGSTVVAPMTDMFWGDRMGKVEDPFGIQWGIAKKIEDLNPEEVDRRAAEWVASMQASQNDQA